MKDYYSILGCVNSASLNEIKSKYQELILKYHPDKQGPCAEEDQRFIVLHEAWKVLRDPEQRKKYDAELLQSKYLNKPLILVSLESSELEWCADSSSYQYPCRCGGMYSILKSDLNQEDCYTNCEECSLIIHIKSTLNVKNN